LFNYGPAFRVASIVTAGGPGVGLRNTETARAISHIHIFVPRLLDAVGGGGGEKTPTDGFTRGLDLVAIVGARALVLFRVRTLVRAWLDKHILLRLHVGSLVRWV
jgi:hypothetical protein